MQAGIVADGRSKSAKPTVMALMGRVCELRRLHGKWTGECKVNGTRDVERQMMTDKGRRRGVGKRGIGYRYRKTKWRKRKRL
jgi:hypothetical protein